MRKNLVSVARLAGVSAVLLAMASCSPMGDQATETPGPVTTATVTSPPPEDPRPTQIVEPSGEPTELEELGEDAYPAEVDGFTMTWQLGQPIYDRSGTSEGDERIVIEAQIEVEDASQYDWGVRNNHQELRPGVWCFINDRGWDNCTTNSSSGRLFLSIDMLDTLTTDDLALWTEEFIAQVP